jgi:hypothetical protein
VFSQVYYLIRSQLDGQYLVANLDRSEGATASKYLLLFSEKFEALSYLNTHAANVADRFAVESVNGNQLQPLLQRWSLSGVGIVQDPLLPKIEFLAVRQ